MGRHDDLTRGATRADTGFAHCEHCGEQMPSNARFCMSCGYERRVGGPADGAETETGSGIIVVSTGGKRPVSHALTDPTEEVVVIDDEGRATLEVRPATVTPDVDLSEPSVEAPETEAPAPAAERQRRRRLRSAPVLVVGGTLLVALLVLAAILLWPDSGEEVDVNAELATGASSFGETVEAFSRADMFAELSAASESATATSETYAGRLATVSEVGDEELRTAATEVLEAEQAFLDSLAFTFSNYRTRDFGDWPNRSNRMGQRLERVETAQQELAALENEDIVATVDVDAAQTLLISLDRLIQDKIDEYTEWRDARNAARGSQFGALTALNNYANPMRNLIGEYTALRDDLADWTRQLDIRPVFISEAYTEMGEALADRQNIRNQMASLRPPSTMAAAHASIVGILDQAISTIQSAREGLDIYLFDPFWAYTDVRQTPGWATFSSGSDGISESLDSAIASWNSARDAEEQRIRSVGVPPRPEL